MKWAKGFPRLKHSKGLKKLVFIQTLTGKNALSRESKRSPIILSKLEFPAKPVAFDCLAERGKGESARRGQETVASMPYIALHEPPAKVSPPLCVDLDGSLVKSDTSMDGLCLFVRQRPTELWRIPIWLASGRARLKAEIASRVSLHPAHLPYNSTLLEYLQLQRLEGRQLVLATGADQAAAKRIASHLGIFDAVVGSGGDVNLTGPRKLARLKQEFGDFDYIGNSLADLPLLKSAGEPMLANPSASLRMLLDSGRIRVARTFADQRPRFSTILKAVRVHQWAKNVLLFVPLLLSHKITPSAIASAMAAFFCFSFMASANYLINDLLDIENDRRHPSKRNRPFAAGDLQVTSGLLLSILLFAGGLALLPLLPPAFDLWLAVYITGTLAYSFYLKQIAVLDVLLLSSLYTLRLLAGAAATGTPISQWLAGFSTLLFLSLGMVKRFSELGDLRERGFKISHGRGYTVSDMQQVRSFGTSSATAAVVMFMLYIGHPDVTRLYSRASHLWLIVPLLIYWLYRVWLLASRGELDDDPVVFALRDRMSLAVGALVVAVAVSSL
jgi:4-hydroxybenzoate polyprenyltransferase